MNRYLSLLSVLIVLFPCFSNADNKGLNGWFQNGASAPQKNNFKSEKGFGAQLCLIEDQSFFDRWNNPDDTVTIPKTVSPKRGKPVFAVILFRNPGVKDSLCAVTGEITVYDPNGAIFGQEKMMNIWNNRKPLPSGQTGLSEDYMGITIEPKDPNGVYRVQAILFDAVKKATVRLETKIEVK
jgi:hypothetical protein